MKKFLTALAVILLLASAGFCVYYFFFKDKPEETQTTYTIVVKSENLAQGTVKELSKNTYSKNESVILEAEPTENYNFEGWYIDSDKISSDNPYTFKVTDNAYITAKFKLKDNVVLDEFSVVLTNANETMGSITELEESSYNKDSKITLKATANEGYYFIGWYDGENLLSKATTFDYYVFKDVTITAKFEQYTKYSLNFNFTAEDMIHKNIGFSYIGTYSYKLDENCVNEGLIRGNITFKHVQTVYDDFKVGFSFNPKDTCTLTVVDPDLDTEATLVIFIEIDEESNWIFNFSANANHISNSPLMVMTGLKISEVSVTNRYLYY